jgi:GTPase KRas
VEDNGLSIEENPCRKQVIVDEDMYMLEIFEATDYDEFSALKDLWTRDGDGFLIVYNIADRVSFNHIKVVPAETRRIKERYILPPSTHPAPTASITGTQFTDIPIVLIGNSSDGFVEREVSTQEGQALARELGIQFMEVSAKNNIDVEKGFHELVRLIRRQCRQKRTRPKGGEENGHEKWRPKGKFWSLQRFRRPRKYDFFQWRKK